MDYINVSQLSIFHSVRLMCLLIGYLCCGLPLSKPPLLCGVCVCVCARVVWVCMCVCMCLFVCVLYNVYIFKSLYDFLVDLTSGFIQSECVCVLVQALRHVRLGK